MDSSTRNVNGWHEIRCLLRSIIATALHSILGLSELFSSIFPWNTSQLTRNNTSVHTKSDPVKMCKTSLEEEIQNIMKCVHSTLTVVTYKVASINKQATVHKLRHCKGTKQAAKFTDSIPRPSLSSNPKHTSKIQKACLYPCSTLKYGHVIDSVYYKFCFLRSNFQ